MSTPFSECQAYVASKLYRPTIVDDPVVEVAPALNTSEHSHLSHLKYGYGRGPSPGMPHLPFSEIVGPVTQPRGTWMDENILNAIRITNRYKNVGLCLSGGIDSELMVAIFLDAGVKFETFFMLYRGVTGDILNELDYYHACRFCLAHDINLIVEEVDICVDIINGRPLEYFIPGIEETKFLLPTLYTQQHMIERINSLGMIPVMASDQVEMKMNAAGQPVIGESLFSLGLSAPTWAHRTNTPVIYDFFMYSPEAVHAYLEIPDVRYATAVGDQFKADISHKYGSKRLGPPRVKATGYENIRADMERVKYDLHSFTMENVDRVDWSKRPMAQYIHSVESVLANGRYCDWQLLRTTPNDFLCRGFIAEDPAYYDI